MNELKLKAKKNCKYCSGSGYINDPYGTDDIISDYCECILDQVPEEYWDNDERLIVVEEAEQPA